MNTNEETPAAVGSTGLAVVAGSDFSRRYTEAIAALDFALFIEPPIQTMILSAESAAIRHVADTQRCASELRMARRAANHAAELSALFSPNTPHEPRP